MFLCDVAVQDLDVVLLDGACLLDNAEVRVRELPAEELPPFAGGKLDAVQRLEPFPQVRNQSLLAFYGQIVTALGLQNSEQRFFQGGFALIGALVAALGDVFAQNRGFSGFGDDREFGRPSHDLEKIVSAAPAQIRFLAQRSRRGNERSLSL